MAKLTFKDYYGWLQDNWLKAGIVAALFYTFLIIVFSRHLDPLGLMLFLSFPIYVIHEIEEYILPGGFADFFNKEIFKVNPADRIQPLDRKVIFWINALYVYIFLPIGAALYTINPILAAWIPYYFLMHSLAHPILGIKGGFKFNAGMITGMLVFIPYGIWMIHLFMQAGIITCPYWNWPMAVGIGLNLLLPIAVVIPLPFGILRRYHNRVKKAVKE